MRRSSGGLGVAGHGELGQPGTWGSPVPRDAGTDILQPARGREDRGKALCSRTAFKRALLLHITKDASVRSNSGAPLCSPPPHPRGQRRRARPPSARRPSRERAGPAGARCGRWAGGLGGARARGGGGGGAGPGGGGPSRAPREGGRGRAGAGHGPGGAARSGAGAERWHAARRHAALLARCCPADMDRRLPLLLLCAALGSAGRLSARPGNEGEPGPRGGGPRFSVYFYIFIYLFTSFFFFALRWCWAAAALRPGSALARLRGRRPVRG